MVRSSYLRAQTGFAVIEGFDLDDLFMIQRVYKKNAPCVSEETPHGMQGSLLNIDLACIDPGVLEL